MKPTSENNGNLNQAEQNGFDSFVLPFITEEQTSTKASPKAPPKHIKTSPLSASPLDLLKKSVKENAQNIAEEKNSADEQMLIKMAENINRHQQPQKPKRQESLLAKCMPYIYDENGVSQVDDKPDYTLESVEDIIEAAEKRASQKIAKMYNLKKSEVQETSFQNTHDDIEHEPRSRLRAQNTSIKKAVKIGESARSSSLFDTVSIPKITDTLFDDFSARRTDVVEDESTIMTYSEISSQRAASDISQTRIIPDLKPETHTEEIYEDILSHTRPVNVKDVPSASKEVFVAPPEPEPFVKVDDFKGADDISRVGSTLKLDLVLSKTKLIATTVFAIAAALMHIPYIKDLFAASPLVPAIISLCAFGASVLVNVNIFKSFKTAFTPETKIEFPLALATGFCSVYFIFGIIDGSYPNDVAILPIMSLLVYNYCAYRRALAVFGNFKLVAARKSKIAVTLINDKATTSSMARSSIEGEVLAAGNQQTDEIGDFLKNTLSDRAVGGKLNILVAVNIIVSVAIGLMIGISYSSFTDALSAVSIVLTFGSAPTLFISEMLPFASFAEKLLKRGAALCSRYSAEKIEQINAAVVTSAQLFPDGCIKLFNINPLSANNIDETMTMAAAVAQKANSPLFPVFCKMLTADTLLAEADSVKYEENLGISGWVDDNHIMIGNRSLMISHGVRIPPLEVDRKILHKGYFPIYVACDQRACALLTVKYTISRGVEEELLKLANKGVTLLIDNCDPNLTEEMLCDYYSLYPDIIKIMDSSGVHKYRLKTEPTEICSAHAFHKGSAISYLSILSSSLRLKSLTGIMYVIHIICTVLLWLIFTCVSLGGSMAIMSTILCLMCELISTIITTTIFFIGKPFHN